MTDMPEAWCCNCHEDFPVAESGPYRMGQLRPLSVAPSRLRERFRSWLGHDSGAYLCGNCYFDILDAEDDAEE